MRETLRAALILGLASGCVEVLLRAEPRLGMSLGERLAWLAAAVGAALVVTLPAGAVASVVGKRQTGLVASALIALHAALWYRFEQVLNLYVSDVRVWGGLLAIALLSLGVGLLLDGLLKRALLPLAVLGALAGVGALVRGSPPSAPKEAATGPSVLLISMDTTRPDRLGAYGGPAATPALDRLAREGTLFSQAVAPAPLTEPSHLTMLTGLPTHRTGVVTNATPLGERPELLSHRFRAAGYVTGGVVAGFPLHGKYGWTQGFDVYDDDFGAMPGLHRLSLVKAWDQLTLPGNTLRERPGDQGLERALRFLDAYGETPFFLWMHFFDPHGPYELDDAELAAAPRDGPALDLPVYWPPPHRSITSEDFLVQAYDAELTRTDAFIEALLERLERLGVLDQTVVVVTADHGESLTEHDYLFDHGDTLYDPSLRVPLIVRAAGRAQAGQRVPCQVGLSDVAPTLAELTGLDLLGAQDEGESLVPELEGRPCSDRLVVSSAVGARFVEDPPIDRSLRTPRSKFIAYGAGGAELYDLVADPGERIDLAESQPEAVSAAASKLERVLEGATDAAMPDLSPDDLEMLQQLGYME